MVHVMSMRKSPNKEDCSGPNTSHTVVGESIEIIYVATTRRCQSKQPPSLFYRCLRDGQEWSTVSITRSENPYFGTLASWLEPLGKNLNGTVPAAFCTFTSSCLHYTDNTAEYLFCKLHYSTAHFTLCGCGIFAFPPRVLRSLSCTCTLEFL